MSSTKKGLSPKACIMMAIGGMVGSSIFTLSGVTYGMAGPAAIVTWFLAGMILLLYALNVAELATTFPKSGGVYVYPHEVLGKTQKGKNFAGWIAAWFWLNTSIFGTTFSAICVSTYMESFFPIVSESRALRMLIPLLWIFLTWFLNARSADAFGKIHNKITMTLLCVLSVYVILGIINGDSINMRPFISGNMGSAGIIAGIPLAMLGYGAIIAVASFGGEIENPKKNIPRIIVTAIICTVTVNCLILFSTFRMAPVGELVAADAQYYPLAFALGRVMTGKWGWVVSIVPLAALLALTGNMSILIMDASRTVMATAQSGFLPGKLGEIHPQKNTPIAALSLVAVICGLLSLRPDWINIIINAGSICSAITVAIISVTLMVLRKKQKTGVIAEKGEFRVPGGILMPSVTLVVILITLVLLYFGEGGTTAYLMAGAWFAAGIIIFAVKEVIKKSDGCKTV
ncbi:APC family permease [Lachnospiraceae bacterium 42-17]